LEEAFDCVDHEILLCKLKFYGIRGDDYTLDESYLSNRYIKTVIYNDMNCIALIGLESGRASRRGGYWDLCCFCYI
jgi:hypothetical protein